MYNDKFLSILSQNFLEILEDNKYCDITFEVGNDPYVKVFHAHMVILNYRSPYLRKILSTEVNKDKDDRRIKLPKIRPENFQTILRYIYGGRFSLEEYNTLDIIKILVASSELGLTELIDHLQLFLIKDKEDWMKQNFNLIYKTSFENDSFLELQNFCTEFISKNPEKIFNSIDFPSLSEKCLDSLLQHLQHDNFQQLNAFKVWEIVLKWIIAQSPNLPSDPSLYFKDDVNTLRNTLQRFIPYIKFFNLNYNEFITKVYPYRRILSKDLRESLINHFKPIKNPKPKITKEIRSESIDSKIITIQHAELISRWIDKLRVTDKTNNVYEFNLILRGSRDGFSPSKFHDICDYKYHTISIIKVKDSDEILGGYNPEIWKSNFSDSNTNDSFIFSFRNKENIKDYILSRVDDERYAICNSVNMGPSFGGGDLNLYGDNCYCQSNCYKFDYEESIRDIEDFFSVEEIEIFQIMKD